jgi:hypothetical protein
MPRQWSGSTLCLILRTLVQSQQGICRLGRLVKILSEVTLHEK